jgi:hypothetical protein
LDKTVKKQPKRLFLGFMRKIYDSFRAQVISPLGELFLLVSGEMKKNQPPDHLLTWI